MGDTTGKDIMILDQKYCFCGMESAVKEIDKDIILKHEQLRKNLEKWICWRDNVLNGKVIYVADPWAIKLEKEDNTDRAAEATIEMLENINEDLQGTINKEIVKTILDGAGIIGVQGSFGERQKVYVLFLNMKEINRCPQEIFSTVLLSVILHETTHILDEYERKTKHKEIEKCDGFTDEKIWKMDDQKTGLFGDEKWKKIFDEEKEYIKRNDWEKITTLVEKIVIGSMEEADGTKDWVEDLVTLLNEVLEKMEIV